MNENEYIVRETNYQDATKQEVIGELVRCKDCINNILGKNYNPLARHKRDCIFKPDNWFCADGERRTDETDQRR